MYLPKYRRFTKPSLFVRKLAANFRAKKYKEEYYRIEIYQRDPDKMERCLSWRDNCSIDISFKSHTVDVVLSYYEGEGRKKEECTYETAIPRIKEILKKQGYIFEEKARKEGLVKHHYPSGKLEFEGLYKNGLEEGKHTYYWENTAIFKIFHYKNGKLDGEYILNDWKGKILEKRTYKEGELIHLQKFLRD